MFLALAESHFESESTLPPQAGNAHRWAVPCKKVEIVEDEIINLARVVFLCPEFLFVDGREHKGASYCICKYRNGTTRSRSYTNRD